MTSQSHLHTQARFFAGTKENNLTRHQCKTTCTLFTPDPAEDKSNLTLNKQHCTVHGNAPKGSGPYLIPQTTYQYKHTSHYK